MGKDLSVIAFMLSSFGVVVPGLPFLGSFLAVISLLTSRGDPDSQTYIAVPTIPLGILLGVFNTALFVGTIGHLGFL
jgi:hypothetical protein